jgi:predicted metalloendopeptidase
MLWKRIPFIVLIAAIAGAQTGSAPTKKPLSPSAAASVDKTESATKTVQRPKSYDIDAMDKTVDPCQNFYEYACGTWRKNNPIPPDQARWGRFNELAEYNRQFLHNILEKVSANDPKRTPVQQKIGDMYQSCMDEAAVNKLGSAPLKPELDRIAGRRAGTVWFWRVA